MKNTICLLWFCFCWIAGWAQSVELIRIYTDKDCYLAGEELWIKVSIDENALPAHTLATYGALVDYLPKNTLSRSANINPNSTIVYLYVPGSGLASYTISSHIVTGAEEVEGVSIKIGANSQEITFGCEVDQAQIYTLSGMLLNSINDATSIDRPSEKGVYILRLNLNGVITTHKIVI